MPWGVAIIGAFLCGGASMMLQHFIVGTTDIDTMVRNIVPYSLFAIYGLVLVVGIFGGKH